MTTEKSPTPNAMEQTKKAIEKMIREDERKKIVEWLRKHGAQSYANRIEAGEHRGRT